MSVVERRIDLKHQEYALTLADGKSYQLQFVRTVSWIKLPKDNGSKVISALFVKFFKSYSWTIRFDGQNIALKRSSAETHIEQASY